MRRVLLTVAAMLFAGQAWAKTWVVPGTDTFAAALAANEGDVVLLSAGSYGSLAPTGVGKPDVPVVWIGSGSCTVSGIVPKSYHRFYGITSSAGVDLPANGKRVMFDGCTINGSLNFKDSDSSSVRNCTVTGTTLTVCRNLAAGTFADDDTLESSVFSGLNATSDFAVQFGSTDGNRVRRFVRRFNRFDISQSGSVGWTPAKHWLTSEMLSYANKFTITSTASGFGSNEGNFGVLLRDSSHTLTMKRDTVLVNNEGASFESYALYTSSGTWPAGMRFWTVDSCYFRVFNGTAVNFQAEMQYMKFRNNIVRSRLGVALSFAFAFQVSSNDPYLHHNTFMGKQAVHFGEYANNNSQEAFTNNILWGTSSATCAEGTGVGGCSNSTPVAISDSNLVYSTTADSTRSFYYTGGCLAPRVGAWAGQSNDTHSYFATPSFTDTTWASLNVKPASGSLAISSNLWTLGYAGASDGTVPAAPAATTPIWWQPSDDDDWFYIRRERDRD